MGTFNENIRNKFAGRPTTVKPHQITNVFFIRLKQSFWARLWKQLKGLDSEYVYLHYEGEVNKEQVAYRLKKGVIGACIFKLEHALEIIRESGAKNLELVKINKVIDKRKPK